MYDREGKFDYGWNCTRDDSGKLKPEYENQPLTQEGEGDNGTDPDLYTPRG